MGPKVQIEWDDQFQNPFNFLEKADKALSRQGKANYASEMRRQVQGAANCPDALETIKRYVEIIEPKPPTPPTRGSMFGNRSIRIEDRIVIRDIYQTRDGVLWIHWQGEPWQVREVTQGQFWINRRLA